MWNRRKEKDDDSATSRSTHTFLGSFAFRRAVQRTARHLALAVIFVGLATIAPAIVFLLTHSWNFSPTEDAQGCARLAQQPKMARVLAQLPPGGLLLWPSEVWADPEPTPTTQCDGSCAPTPVGTMPVATPVGTMPVGWTTFSWSVFHVRPRLNGTEEYLVWQEFEPGNSCPPIWVRVQWGHTGSEVHVETMRIGGNCNVVQSAPNIFWHWIGTTGCDGFPSSSSNRYWRAHGIDAEAVEYDVLYEPGVP